jgi:two-component system response regulator YesN
MYMPIQLLIIDDNVSIVQGINDIIVSHFPNQFIVHTAGNGEEAFCHFAKYPIGLVVTDIKMPGIDGITILNEIKKHNPTCEVLVISAFDDFCLVRKALLSGAYDYLLKPIDIGTFVHLVAKIIPKLKDRDMPLFLVNNEPEGCASPNPSEFFNLPTGKLTRRELEDTLRQTMSAVLRLDADKALVWLKRVFCGVSENCCTEEELRKLLIQFIYTLMDRNQMFIRIISSYKLTEFDIISCIKNLPTIEQIQSRFCNSMVRYIIDLKRDDFLMERYLIKSSGGYINEHCEKSLTLSNVANHLHRHPNYVSALFKSQLGMTFRDYLRKIRIDRAKSMMKTSVTKLNDIAMKVGYQDVSHFNRAFKEVTGLSPSEYRKRMSISGET